VADNPLSPKAIADALDAALENGYDMKDEPVLAVALDMVSCHADYDHIDAAYGFPDELLAGIEQWQAGRRRSD
jgi:hypothetical protein